MKTAPGRLRRGKSREKQVGVRCEHSPRDSLYHWTGQRDPET